MLCLVPKFNNMFKCGFIRSKTEDQEVKEGGKIGDAGPKLNSTTFPPTLCSARPGHNGMASKGPAPEDTMGKFGREDVVQDSSVVQGQIRFDHFAVATGLIVTYFVEIIVQIFLVVECYRPLLLTPGNSSDSWDWYLVFSLTLLICSLLVTCVSLSWVCQGLDFAGRLCGRLLCYFLHLLMLGLLWRFLKLAFVYDRADVYEFAALRKLQIFVQSIPLTAVHIAWLVYFRENWSSVMLGIVVLELLSILTALALSSYIKSDDQCVKSKGQLIHIIARNLTCSPRSAEGEEVGRRETGYGPAPTDNCRPASLSCCSGVLETKLHLLSRACLLCTRLLVIAIIILNLKFWTSLFLAGHFVLAFAWISFTVNAHRGSSSSSSSTGTGNILLDDLLQDGEPIRPKEFLLQVTEWTYALFWDVTAIGEVPLSTRIFPIILVLIENGTTILFGWYHYAEPALMTFATACLLLGWFCFSLINVHKLSSANNDKCRFPAIERSLKNKRTSGSDAIRYQNDQGNCQPQGSLPVVDPIVNEDLPNMPASDPTDSRATTIKTQDICYARSSSTELETKNVTKTVRASSASWTETEVDPQLNVRDDVIKREKVKKYKKILKEPATVEVAPVWSPDSCCNDSNSSSNSRNTNTLGDPCNLEHEEDADGETCNFVFFYPDTVAVQQSVTSARFLKCNDHRPDPNNRNPPSPIFPVGGSGSVATTRTTFSTPPTSPIVQGNFEAGTKAESGHQQHRSTPSVSSSSVNIRQYRTSTPVEIKQASRIVVNSVLQPPSAPKRKLSDGALQQCACNSDKKTKADIGRSDVKCNRQTMQQENRHHKTMACDDKRSSVFQAPATSKVGKSLGIVATYQNRKDGRNDSQCSSSARCIGPKSNNNDNIIIKSEISSSSSSCSPLLCSRGTTVHRGTVLAPAVKKLKVLCAKCLQNHDPLLTNCVEAESCGGGGKDGNETSHILLALRPAIKKSSHHVPSMAKTELPTKCHVSNKSNNGSGPLWEQQQRNEHGIPALAFVQESASSGYDYHDDILLLEEEDCDGEDERLEYYTTDYPSETEMTCTVQGEDDNDDDQGDQDDEDYNTSISSSNLSTATYTTWPHPSQPNLSMWTTSTMMPPSRFPKQFTSLEYVRTWLLSSHARLLHQPSLYSSSKVHRSNTMTAQSRKVRFADIGTKPREPEVPARKCGRNKNCEDESSGYLHQHRRSRRKECMSACSYSPKNFQSRFHKLRPELRGLPAPRLSGGESLKESHQAISRSSPPTSSLLFHQPPPRQKQHPMLPNTFVISTSPKVIHPHSRCHTSSRHVFDHHLIDSYYKDLEIIL